MMLLCSLPVGVYAQQTGQRNADGISMTNAQQFISGKVIDEAGEPIIGASVHSKDGKYRTVTDPDGNFSIKSDKQNQTLRISYIGYDATEVNAVAGKPVRIVLTENAQLDEVVVVGYGTMRRSDVTGSISSVKGKELTKNSSANVVQTLAGKVAGVQVVQNSGAPGGDVSILIRGVGTINDASPLYVIDGVPVNGGMWYLNPADIETIDVLKDASATAIYGSRGANGVVIVTTRRAQEGRTEINLDYSFGIQQSAKMFDMMNASQYAALHNEMRSNAGMSLNPLFADPESLGAGTDWLSPMFRTAPMHKVNLSILGGNARINHATSLGYYAQEGIMKNSDFNRLNLKSNISSQILKNVKVSANINLSAENRRNQPVSTVIQNSMRMLPHIPIRDEEGNYTGPTGNAELNGDALNSIAIINEQNYRMKGFRMLSNLSAEWEIIDGLTIKTTGGAELGYEYNNSYLPKYKWGNKEQVNTLQTLSSAYEELYLWDNQLSYDKKFGKHKLNAMIGTSYQQYKKEWMSATGSGRASEMTTELDNATKATDVGGNSYAWALMSYMGRVHYSYDNRYFLTATFRADGSSKFGANNRFGYFPSFSAAWNISNESFMERAPWISMLKLRLGYGLTGNQNIDAYAFADKLEVNGAYSFGSQRGFEATQVSLIYPYKLSNPSIKWESVEQYNVGLDMGFLNDRIVANVDFYLKNTNDMLTKKPVPQTSGTSLVSSDWPPVNIGKVRNTGVEISLNTKNFVGEFTWETTLNMTFNKNKVLKLGGPEILSGVSLIREGLPINSFYGFIMGGIYQNLDEVFSGVPMENRAQDRESHNSKVNTSPGDIWFVNTDNNDVIDDFDRTVIGNANPNFTFGWNNTVNYKNWDLSMFLTGAFGMDRLNLVRYAMSTSISDASFINTKEAYEYNWDVNPNNAKFASLLNGGTNYANSTQWVENASYVRLANLSIGYTFPKSKTKFADIRLSVSCQNLFTITKYKGMDPTASAFTDDSSKSVDVSSGVDIGGYPTPRTFTFGVKMNF